MCNGAPSHRWTNSLFFHGKPPVGKFNSNRKRKDEGEKKLDYKPELSKVGHLDFSHASQNLHHVKTFIRLEPTGDEEGGKDSEKFERKQE